MRGNTRALIVAGLGAEIVVTLIPPMRATLEAAPGNIVAGRTRHLFLFSHLGGPWTVDTGRLLAYTLLIASIMALAIVTEDWFHHSRVTASAKSPATDPPAPSEAASPPLDRLLLIGALLLLAIFIRIAVAVSLGGNGSLVDQLLGMFLGGSLLFGCVFGVLGHFFWRGRHDVTLLIVAALDAMAALGAFARIANPHLHP